MIAKLTVRTPTEDDILAMHVCPFEDSDTDAMEMLGYPFTAGWGVRANYRRAYGYYGLAYLAGVDRVGTNLDSLWPFLSVEEQDIVTEWFQNIARKLDSTY